MTTKIIFPLFVGVPGVSAATATTISTGVFSPKKCWYDGEVDGSFLKEVEKVLQEKHSDKDNSEVKDLIKSLCTLESGISLTEFEQKFGLKNYSDVNYPVDYSDVYNLLSKKRSEIKKPENKEKN